MRVRVAVSTLAVLMLSAEAALAQNWSFDARTIALGGVGGSGNLSSKMIDEQRDYRAIVLPFGLLQVFSNLDTFDPNSRDFNPVRDIEYAAGPLHFVIGRNNTSNSGETKFVSDIRNATLSRDLNAYRGFVPANNLLAEGLAAPNFGGTIKVHRDAAGGFQGIYIGAGPYFSMHTAATIDQGLTNLLASDVPVTVRNAVFPLTSTSEGQLALAVTGGYRGRFAWPSGVGSKSAREGFYVAANYNYLRGFEYDNISTTVRLDTDSAGLVTLVPSVTPILIDRGHATKGNGFAIDLGVGAVINQWELGFGANGIANRIDWTDIAQTRYSLGNLLSGNNSFLQETEGTVPTTRVELPVDTRGYVGYYADRWSAAAQAGHGFGGGSFHGGVERRFGVIELRGGARYTTEKWNPTGGIGFNLSRRVSLDLAAFGTHANIERKRQVALAASLRFNHLK